jgi:hypothetical protein
VSNAVWSQEIVRDTLTGGNIIIEKDKRIGLLGESMRQYYESLAKKNRLMPGYRLMLLSSSDRKKIMDLRSKLLQLYPDQKLYSVFQTPYIKLKMGNFLLREEAEAMQKQLMALGIIEGNIYVVPEKVELTPEQYKEAMTPEVQ